MLIPADGRFTTRCGHSCSSKADRQQMTRIDIERRVRQYLAVRPRAKRSSIADLLLTKWRSDVDAIDVGRSALRRRAEKSLTQLTSGRLERDLRLMR